MKNRKWKVMTIMIWALAMLAMPVCLWAQDYRSSGSEAFRDQAYQEAVKFVDQAIEKDWLPKEVLAEALSVRGMSWAAQDDLQLALDDLNRALAIDPEFARGYVQRGAIRVQRNELDLALADYDRALKIDTKLSEVYLKRGLLWVKKGRPDLALADWNTYLSRTMLLVESYYQQGEPRPTRTSMLGP